MGVKIFKRVKSQKPDLFACWPGIGNIGLLSVDFLRRDIKAEKFAEIEPWDFFYPGKVSIKGGLLEDLEFPRSEFYFQRVGQKDLLFFLGEEQPREKRGLYARGEKAYRMANLVLDVAEELGCRRIYTSGAAVAPIHHSLPSKVWAVVNQEKLIKEIEGYPNIILMSQVEGADEQGMVTGLNGLLLGVAKERGLEGICLMGEIPFYLQAVPLAYPKASKSVLEALLKILRIRVNLERLNSYIVQAEAAVERFYRSLPSEVRDQLEKFKSVPYLKPTPTIPEMSPKDRKKLMEDIERFLKREGGSP